MKTFELKLKKDVLIVEAPLDAYDVSIGTHCIGVRTNENVEKDTNGFYHIYKKGLFFGDFNMKLEFICKGSELTEEIVSEFIEKFELDFNKEFCVFKDYINDCNRFSKSIPSFISAIESKGFYWLVNPIEIIERGEDTEHNRVINQNKWQEAEEKTFKNPLIFIKNYVQ